MKTAVIKTVSKGKRKGEFRFVLCGSNGEPVAQSYPETYTQKHNCIKTLKNCFSQYKIMPDEK